MFERFTDRARRVLVLAQEEARLLNDSFIGTEHLLLGLIKEEEGVAAAALASLGVSLGAVRAQVKETIGRPDGAPSGSPPFTPRAKKVLELSLRESSQLGHTYIGTEHLLLGLVREGEGVAAQALVSLGVDLGRVRQQVIQLISGYQGKEGADAGADASFIGSRPPLRRHPGRPLRRARSVMPPVVILVCAGLVGFAAGWVASRLTVQTMATRLTDAEAQLDQLIDAARAQGHHRLGRVR